MAAETGFGQPSAETSSKFYVPMPRLLRLFWLGVVLLAFLTWLSTWLLIRQHGSIYPYNDPIFIESSFQTDFVLFGYRFRSLFGTPAFYAVPPPLPFTYPAPMGVVYHVFYRYIPHPHRAFLLASAVAYLIAATLFARALVKRNLRPSLAWLFSATVLILSYPGILQLFVANMEVFVWIILALGIWAYTADHHWSAATCFGIAASLKLFPFIYFALLLSKRKYKEIAFGAAVFAAVTLVSLHVLGPDISTANRGIESGLKHFQKVYVFMFHAPESGMDHSLFAVIKLGLYHWRRLDLLPVILRPYLIVTASLGILLYFLRIRHLPLFNQVLALTVASVLLPPVSHDYTLLHLYTPFVILTLGMLATPPDAWNRRRLVAVLLVCFLLLFSSENYLILYDIRFAGQIKAGILLLLFVIALRWPLDLHPFPKSSLPLPVPA